MLRHLIYRWPKDQLQTHIGRNQATFITRGQRTKTRPDQSLAVSRRREVDGIT